MDVKLDGKLITGLIYIMNKEFDYYIPTYQYVDIFKKGWNYFYFDQEILEKAYEVSIENVAKVYKKSC